jgi:hypothetical protein
MIAHKLKGVEAHDALSRLIRSHGGLVTTMRGVPDVRFELPAETAEVASRDVALLGYRPQFLRHELRLGGVSVYASISVFRLRLDE